jgi:hypothetical protein
MKIEQLFSLEPFDAQETPRLIRLFEHIVVVPLVAFWASGAYVIFEFLRGNRLLAGVLFPFWAIAVVGASAALHRAGHARIGLSLGTTFVVLLATVFAWFTVKGT